MGLGRLGCVAASILVGAVQCASGGNPTVRPSIAIEPSALKFHLADWDRDGFADLAARETEDGQLRIRRNDGTGAFVERPRDPHLASLGAGPSAVGDFDGDGRADLAVFPKEGPPAFRFARGRGDGSFDPPVTVPLTAAMTQFAVADIDRDGADDVALTMSGAFGVRMKLAGAVVGFDKPAPFASGIGAADFDGNGAVDLVVQRWIFGTEIWSGDGTGLFGSPVPVPVDLAGAVFAAGRGDIDGDGQPELLTWSTSSHAIVLHRFDAGWNASVVATLQTDLKALLWVTLRDVSGDGRADVVAADGLGTIVWFESAGGGSFGAPHEVEAGLLSVAGESGFDCADLNGDGLSDFLALSSAKRLIAMRAQDGGLGLTALPTSPALVWKPMNTAAADVDADGDLDLVGTSATPNGGGQLVTTLNAGDGALTLGPISPLSTWMYDVATASVDDFDGDGFIDALLWHDQGSVRIAQGAGTGAFASISTLLEGGEPTLGLSIADVDQDGDPDVIASRNHQLLAFRNDGNRAFTPMPPTATNVSWGDEGRALALTDVDGDGIVDVLTGETPSGVVGYGIAVRHGNSNFSFGAPTIVGLDDDPIQALAIGDLDGDGDDDVGARRGPSAEPDVETYANEGAPGLVFVQREELSFGTTYVMPPSITDLDADGQVDLVTGGSQVLNAFYGSGDGRLAPDRAYAVTSVARLVADLDGDGILEIVSEDKATQREVTTCSAKPTPNGTGCPGAGVVTPQLSAMGCATSGAVLTFRVEFAPPSTTAWIVFSAAPGVTPDTACALQIGGPSWVLVPMPLSPTGGGAFGGTLTLTVPHLASAMKTYAQALIAGTQAKTNGMAIPAGM